MASTNRGLKLKHRIMKFVVYPAIASLAMLASYASAQTSSGVPPVSSESIQETQKNQTQKSKVILSRSTDENGQTTDGPPSQAEKLPPVKVAASSIPAVSAEDAERTAPTFTGFDFDLRLRPAENHLAVRALITLRNDSKTPLAHLPLQLSSSLD